MFKHGFESDLPVLKKSKKFPRHGRFGTNDLTVQGCASEEKFSEKWMV